MRRAQKVKRTGRTPRDPSSPTTHTTRCVAGIVILVGLLSTAVACSARIPPPLHAPPRTAIVTTAGPNQSMTYIARIEGGVMVIDLGWWGAEDALEDGLSELGASPDDVIAVFITHAHRDHLGAWRTVRHASFFLGKGDEELLLGRERPGGWIPRWADRIRNRDLPKPGELQLHTFASDTAMTLGADTVHAFPVPGHTPGSTAYLFRGTLFAGDAISHTPISGFGPARRGYSDDAELAREALVDLRTRLVDHEVQRICTAHGTCSEFSDEFWEDVLGDDAVEER